MSGEAGSWNKAGSDSCFQVCKRPSKDVSYAQLVLQSISPCFCPAAFRHAQPVHASGAAWLYLSWL